jgi:hypothetical protein
LHLYALLLLPLFVLLLLACLLSAALLSHGCVQLLQRSQQLSLFL